MTEKDSTGEVPAISKGFVSSSVFHTRNRMAINNADDFGFVASDIFHEYLEGFTLENNLVRTLTEDDWVDEDEASFLYTTRGQYLAEKMLRLLHKVGEKHFPGEDIDISTHLYKEF